MQANTSTRAEKTTPKQDKLIAALLAGHPIVLAAQIAGCNEATAHAWLKLPHVQASYRDAQRLVFDEAISQLLLDTGEARKTLKAIMNDVNVQPGARVRAAQILLEQSIEMHKTSELEHKIARLETMIETLALAGKERQR